METYTLVPVGSNLFRKEDRVNSSHVLYKNGSIPIISDGLVTYEKVNTTYLALMWLSLILGLIGIIIIFLRGSYLLFQKKLFKKLPDNNVPIFIHCWAFDSDSVSSKSIFSKLRRYFTFANVLLAIVTGTLPIAMIFW